jgi:hypothetical protein
MGQEFCKCASLVLLCPPPQAMQCACASTHAGLQLLLRLCLSVRQTLSDQHLEFIDGLVGNWLYWLSTNRIGSSDMFPF